MRQLTSRPGTLQPVSINTATYQPSHKLYHILPRGHTVLPYMALSRSTNQMPALTLSAAQPEAQPVDQPPRRPYRFPLTLAGPHEGALRDAQAHR